jgi:hypothetical protein
LIRWLTWITFFSLLWVDINTIISKALVDKCVLLVNIFIARILLLIHIKYLLQNWINLIWLWWLWLLLLISDFFLQYFQILSTLFYILSFLYVLTFHKILISWTSLCLILKELLAAFIGLLIRLLLINKCYLLVLKLNHYWLMNNYILVYWAISLIHYCFLNRLSILRMIISCGVRIDILLCLCSFLNISSLFLNILIYSRRFVYLLQLQLLLFFRRTNKRLGKFCWHFDIISFNWIFLCAWLIKCLIHKCLLLIHLFMNSLSTFFIQK